MDNEERIIRDLKETMSEIMRVCSRDTLTDEAISNLATQLNQANNYAQQLKGIRDNNWTVKAKG